MNRHELAQALLTADKNLYVSNIKFFNLLVSRLSEHSDLSYDDALVIASSLKYDFSNVPEDNDILTQIATELAEYCYKIYKLMKLNGIKNISYVTKYFQPVFSLSVDNI